jgi:hypothetical protein
MFHRIQDDEKFLDSVIFSDESTFYGGAGSGTAKIHVSSWNIFVTAQRCTCFVSSAKKECPETTITGIVYLDMLQQFPIRQLDEMATKDAYTSSKRAHTHITLEK